MLQVSSKIFVKSNSFEDLQTNIMKASFFVYYTVILKQLNRFDENRYKDKWYSGDDYN